MEYLNAFWVGGLICALVQILMEKTKLMPGRIMVLLVCSGAILGALNIYQPIVEYAGAGATVPLLGFGNTLWKGVKEAVANDGLLGIFTGGFTAGAGGICAALVFGYLMSLLMMFKVACSNFGTQKTSILHSNSNLFSYAVIFWSERGGLLHSDQFSLIYTVKRS